MIIFLAGVVLGTKNMNIFLAGNLHDKERFNIHYSDIYVLESYYYIVNKKWIYPLLSQFKGFLLDSGAFTYMNSKKNEKVDWDIYIEEYANFINQLNIDLFFELDIDTIIGLKEVERLRAKLELLTGKKSIPVWHKSRGLEYWIKMVKEYDYVAIGGLVTMEIKKTEYDVFIHLLKIAKENNCKVHGLGFTNLKGLQKYKFDSVDSTTWLAGNRYGSIHSFNGKTIKKRIRQKGKRVIAEKVAMHNFKEWVKFSQYAEKNL